MAANLGLFIALTASPAFQRLHHHWIFPILALVLAVEWALLGGRLQGGWAAAVSLGSARQAVLSLLAFLILMGVVRHETILACVGRCSFKLAGAALVAALVFSVQRMSDEGFWDRNASELAALGCLLWSVFLVLFGFGIPARKLDALFLGVAVLLFAIGPRGAPTRAAALGIPVLLAVRHAFGEVPIIVLDLGLVVLALGFVRANSRW